MATLLTSPVLAAGLSLERTKGAIRVATFNTALSRKGAGVLLKDIAARHPQVMAVAEIILRVRPDIILLNEIDHDPEGRAAARFADLLAEGVGGLDGLTYPHLFTAPVNTGVPSGFDLDGDGRTMKPEDALGWGRYPGHFGMVILSRFPIAGARTFQNLPWSNVPATEAPRHPDGTAFYPPEAWAVLPLSSKSHWDVRINLPDGRPLHLLASHPTPPVFDGPENRNGLRNAAEIGFWRAYLDGAGWITDDAGQAGGLPDGAHFVLLGDLNNDPDKGDGDDAAIQALLGHKRLQDPQPASPGAAAAGAPVDTADWPETNGPGNLRVDYVLPSRTLTATGTGVFWPAPGAPHHDLVDFKGRAPASSDHRLVWVDLEAPE